MTARGATLLLMLARVSAGPLVLVGFFLPWADGPGALAATEFTGYRLVGFAGNLRVLELPLVAGGAIALVRGLLVGLVVAAVWHTALAPRHPHYTVYRATGWYLVALAVAAALLGIARAGLEVPRPGLGLFVLGAALFALSEGARLARGCFGRPAGQQRTASDLGPARPVA